MPKKNRVAIYEYLFKEGVLVAKKDFTLPKHPEIDVPNLHVIKALTVSYLTRRTNKHHILLSSTLTDRQTKYRQFIVELFQTRYSFWGIT